MTNACFFGAPCVWLSWGWAFHNRPRYMGNLGRISHTNLSLDEYPKCDRQTSSNLGEQEMDFNQSCGSGWGSCDALYMGRISTGNNPLAEPQQMIYGWAFIWDLEDRSLEWQHGLTVSLLGQIFIHSQWQDKQKHPVRQQHCQTKFKFKCVW